MFMKDQRALKDLVKMGTKFDQENGEFALTKESAHSQRRILHANGDATGFEIVRALSVKAVENPRIEVWDDHLLSILLPRTGSYRALVQKPDGSVSMFAEKRRSFVQAAQASSIGIRPTLKLLPGMELQWLIGLVHTYRMWSLFNSIPPHFVTG